MKLLKAALSKHERSDKFDEYQRRIDGALKEDYNVAEGEELDKNIKKLAKNYYDDLQYYVVRDMILE